MPHVKPVSSLQFCCFQLIAENFKLLENSLQSLPDKLIMRLYEQRKKLNLNVYPLPTIFINPETRRLEDLNDFGRRKCLQRVFKRISSVSMNLTKINLTGLTSPPEHLTLLMHHIPRIQKLTLDATACNKSVLTAIGDHCTDIVYLSLTSCTDVDDAGIESLCMTSDSISRNKKIIVLKIICTPVTEMGHVTALRHLPQLKWLYGQLFTDDSSELFEEVSENFQCLSPLFVIQTKADLEIASKSFPNAIYYTVKLNNDIWQNHKDVIEACPNIEQIEILEVLKSNLPITSTLITRNFSPNLKIIQIKSCYFKDIFTLCRFFPRLKHLLIECVISDSSQAIEQNLEMLPGFQSLVRLHLHLHYGHSNICEYAFEKMLVNCKHLQDLGLKNCKVLTDDLVERVALLNPLKDLMKLYISQCEVITVEGVLVFVMMDNPLSKLGVFDCENVSEDDILTIKNRARECNLDIGVYTDWSDWDE